MDPLTAFSLTCGVIQVVDFSAKIVGKCRELYKDGASSENKEIESMARHLTDLATDLTVPDTILPNIFQNPGSAPQLYPDEQELRKLAQQCSRTAAKLIDELEKLSIQSRHRKRDAFRKTLKIIWKRDTIEGIQRSLEQHRRTLDTRILITLRKHVHLIASEQSDGFRNFDRKLQNLIIGIDSAQSTFDTLKDLIKAEDASIKQCISQEFQKHREMIATEGKRRLLESLYFPDLHAREEGIDGAHKQTFEWIFDKTGNEVRPWHHFIDWLEKGHGTYWISGKAGSGKSTLMNFICHDPRTDAALRIWSGMNEIFMPSFFFWSPGSHLQKSLAGLLRSLIYQIMERFPDLKSELAKSIGPSQYGLHQLPTWTEQRLRITLQHLLSVGLEKHHVCIFIDGLDEFQGDHDTLLDLIRNLRQTTRVKFCLSSRPYRPFKDELSSSPMLRLQDLTDPDIRRYVSDRLEGAPLKESQVLYTSFRIKDAVDTIVWKAEGVFLWVKLAVRDQLEGIRNGDNAELLQERLQILPTEIEEVYAHMLQGIEKVYRPEVARYIQLVLGENRWSLFELGLAEHKCIDDILLLSPDISVSDVRQHCKSIGERIATTCKGFIEVHEDMDLEHWRRVVTEPWDERTKSFSESLKDRKMPLKQRDELIETKFLQSCTKVEFLHRTAFDFFKDNEQGKEFLKTYTSANPHLRILHVKASLAGLILFPLSKIEDEVQMLVGNVMRSASYADEDTGVAQLTLMDLLNRSMTLLYESSQWQPSNLHWSKTWGDRDGLHLNSSIDPIFEPRVNRAAHAPVDFLGLAAFHGLNNYVGHIIESQSRQWTAGIVEYLLCCTVCGLGRADIPLLPPYLKLTSVCLKRGADPNRKFHRGTGWSHFLYVLFHHLRVFPTPDDINSEFRKIALAFLESGANANEKVYCSESFIYDIDRDATFATRSEDSQPIALLGCKIRFGLSARAIVRQCFAKDPDFFEIENALIASGAFLYVECTRIKFYVEQGEICYWLDSKLSKERLDLFADTIKDRLGTLLWDYSAEPMRDEIVELSQELDIEKLLEPRRREKELQRILNHEQSSQEDESSTDTDSISDGATTSARITDMDSPSHSAHSSEADD